MKIPRSLWTGMFTTALVLLNLAEGVAIATPAQAAGDAANGAKVAKKCFACHNLDSDQAKVGPGLKTVYGRLAGSVPGYSYSQAMQTKAAEIGNWDEGKLDAYLSNPSAYLGGSSKMSFRLSKEQDRLDIIAYLKSLAKP